MGNSIFYFLSPIFIGIGATLIFDLWGLFLKYAYKITPSNFCLVGRWIRYVPEGIFMHANIGSAPQKRAECTIGWISHYMVGLMFAIAYIALTGEDWLEQPTLMPAVTFGLVTVLMPFFIMQPAFGLGFAASKVSNPVEARLRSLMNHTIFGLGLYLCGVLVSWLL
jgi:hypothetical protein